MTIKFRKKISQCQVDFWFVFLLCLKRNCQIKTKKKFNFEHKIEEQTFYCEVDIIDSLKFVKLLLLSSICPLLGTMSLGYRG
jgi:hypothetical protein